MLVNITRAAADVRAQTLALALAETIGWTVDRAGPALSTPFASYLHVPSAQLLLVPTTAGLDFARRQDEPATRLCRSDALILSLPENGRPLFAFATWARSATCWTLPLLLWLGTSGEPWLVPTGENGDRLGFRLVDALHSAGRVPWEDHATRRAGLDRATAWLAEAW